MKDKNLFLPVLILGIVAIPVFIILVEADFGFVSALGGGVFSGMAVSGLLFYKRWSLIDKEAADKKAAILQPKLDAIPKIETPCLVSIYRPSSLLGGMMSVFVFLHDVRIGELKNGKTFSFSTYYATNTMKLIYEADDTTIRETFSADAGGSLRYKLNYRKGILEKN